MTFGEWELKRFKQLLDFLDLEAVVDDAEEEEEFDNEESGCYDRGSDFSARLLTGYDYGIPQVSSHISHGQYPQSAVVSRV